MINKILSLFKSRSSPTYPLSQVPEGFFRLPRTPGAVTGHEEALTLSPFFAALRLYQSQIASLPLVTYKRLADGGRERAHTHKAYPILHERPNRVQSRATFLEQVVKDYFIFGEAFVHVRRDGEGNVFALHTIPHHAVVKVDVEEYGNDLYKIYTVRTVDGEEVYDDAEVVHVIHYSECGFRGVPFLRYAAESLGLHRQVLEASNAYYANAVRPSIYIKAAGAMPDPTRTALKNDLKEFHSGTANRGSTLMLHNADVLPMPGDTAEDAQVIAALSLSVSDVARWFGLDSLLLGDAAANKYASLSAANEAVYQKSLMPVLSKLELELNAKLFGVESDVYAEFMVGAILRGDPSEQANVLNAYIQSGVMTRSEARELLNLPPIEGLDVPLAPLNQGAVGEEQPADAAQVPDQLPAVEDVGSLSAILDKVVSGEYAPDAAVLLIQAAFPKLPPATVRAMVDSLAQPAQPQPQPTVPGEPADAATVA